MLLRLPQLAALHTQSGDHMSLSEEAFGEIFRKAKKDFDENFDGSIGHAYFDVKSAVDGYADQCPEIDEDTTIEVFKIIFPGQQLVK